MKRFTGLNVPIYSHLFMFANSIFTCMHAVAEAGLLAQRALFMSHRLLGPNVAIEAIDLPADDIFFFRFSDGKQPQCNKFIISLEFSQHISENLANHPYLLDH